MRDEKKAVAEAVWLHYFNNYLFEHGCISEELRSRTAVRINSRGAAQPKGR